LRELVQIDFAWRRKRGQQPTPQEYYLQFPQLTDPDSGSHLAPADVARRLDSDQASPPTIDPPSAAETHALPDIDSDVPPQRIGKYLVTAEIARNSGQAIVY